MAVGHYVVLHGRRTGIFPDWKSCKKQVKRYSRPVFKRFDTLAEAEEAFRVGDLRLLKNAESNKAKPKSTSNKTRPITPKRKSYSASEIQALSADIKIFTDGACWGNPGQAGSGVALYRDNRLDELWYGLYEPMGTNNSAELNALYHALMLAAEQIETGKSVAIFCDSTYVIDAVTKWAVSWKKHGWTKKDGEIKNLELIKPMFEVYQSLGGKVQVLHVRAHVGVEGNELADRMSMVAIEAQEYEFVQYPGEADIDALLAPRAA
ncbi:MAG: viroplasmin family protein [Pseudohongiella sp.]|nr:viroplasmin family protein [Pseudohongiella sp.]